MFRRVRSGTAGYLFHVLNRVIEGATLFYTAGDYDAFLAVLKAATDSTPELRLLGYAVMPTHWHLVVWPHDDMCLSEALQWLTATHAKRWRKARATAGRGAVYQSRFKAIPVQREHFLRLMHYVERNPVSGRCVPHAEDWPWSSASPRAHRDDRPVLSAWPVSRPEDWLERLNVPAPRKDVDAIREALRKGLPLGDARWTAAVIATLHWPVSGNRRGKPSAINRGTMTFS